MKQIILPIIATILFIVVVGLFVQGKLTTKTNNKTNETGQYLTINKTKIQVEVADSTGKREVGLSGRKTLEEGKGMLFIFPQKEVSARFWMKNMLIPIDIIWIKDERIFQIDKDVMPPAEGIADNKLQLYTTKEPINYVLEIPAGYSTKSNFKVGDSVDLSQI